LLPHVSQIESASDFPERAIMRLSAAADSPHLL
jgi:hypothetical protein